MDLLAGIKTYIFILSSCILYPVLILLAGLSVLIFYECGSFFVGEKPETIYEKANKIIKEMTDEYITEAIALCNKELLALKSGAGMIDGYENAWHHL